jgi:hypothetical protein
VRVPILTIRIDQITLQCVIGAFFPIKEIVAAEDTQTCLDRSQAERKDFAGEICFSPDESDVRIAEPRFKSALVLILVAVRQIVG